MADFSTHLSLPFLIEGQAGRDITHNEALRALDALVQMAVIDRDRTAPPPSPTDGDRHIVAATATGDWAGQEGRVAMWADGGWLYFTPRTGWFAWVAADGLALRHDGTGWNPEPLATHGGWGAASRAAVLTAEATGLSGASANTGLTIPARAIVLGVSVRTKAAITGATSYDAGIAGEVSKFGGSLGVAAGSVNIGVIGPQAFFADTDVILTANGGNFTGGAVRAALHLLTFDAPEA